MASYLMNEISSNFRRNRREFQNWFQNYYEKLVSAMWSLRDPQLFRSSLQVYAGTLYRDQQLKEAAFRSAYSDAGTKMAAAVQLADRIYYDDESLGMSDIFVFGHRLYRMVTSMLALMLANARKNQTSAQFDFIVSILRSDLIDW